MKQKQEKIRVLKCDGYYSKPIGDIILHDIPPNRKVCGIYKITFGEKFYIGQSFHIAKRAKAHRSEINKLCNASQVSGKRSTIISYLKDDKSICCMDVFVLEECKESDLQVTEQKWLSLSINDKKCLNSNFKVYVTPQVAMAKKFNPINVQVNITMDTQRQLRLYEKFLTDLESIKKNPRANLKSWF